MNVKSTIGGLAGACALTLLNQGAKKIDKDAPRMDLLGMNAAAKLMKGDNIITKTAGSVFPIAIASDLVANTLYFGMADTGGDNNKTLIRGTLLGLGAGIGAVALPKSLGLDEAPTNRTLKTKVLTVAWYVIGGLVAAGAINLLQSKKQKLQSRKK